MTTNIQNFKKFLDKNKTTGKLFTHTSMSGGSWNIPSDQQQEFYKLYANVVTDEEFHLTEKHTPNYGPIVIDFDFKFANLSKPRIINKKIWKCISNILIKIVKDMFGSKHNYTCVILQRPKRYSGEYKKKEIWTDGLHIQFPFIVCDYIFHYALRDKFIDLFKSNDDDNYDFVSLTDIKFLNSIDDIYDKAVIERNNWCLYLSTKPGKNAYEIVDIYESDTDWMNATVRQKIQLLSIRNKNNIAPIIPLNFDHVDLYAKKISIESQKNITDHENPKLFEIKSDQKYNEKKILKILNRMNQKRVDNYQDWINVGMILHNCAHSDKNNKIDYLKIWDSWSKRSEKYDKGLCQRKWKYFDNFTGNRLTLGTLIYYAQIDNPIEFNLEDLSRFLSEFIFYFKGIDLTVNKAFLENNICYLELKEICCPFVGHSHDQPLIYIEIRHTGMSLKCSSCTYKMLPSKGSVPICNYALKNIFKIKSMSDISLGNQISYRDPPEYNIFEDHKLNTLLYAGLDPGHYNFVELIHYIYKDTLNCTKTSLWYTFLKHRWVEGDSQLYSFISHDIVNYYIKMINFYKNISDHLIEDEDDEEDHKKKDVTTKIDLIKNVIDRLKNVNFKAGIISDASRFFYLKNEKFEQMLNQKLHLFGCNNGVYDLDNDLFRDGQPDDYITISCGYDYDPNIDFEKEIMQILRQIMPNENILTYVLKSFSSCLSGYTHEQKVMFLNGEGANGKSLVMAFIKKVLGDYYVKGSVALITQKRTGAEQATPRLNKMKTARMIMFSEPNKDDVLNSGIIRELTGGEEMASRGLHKDPNDYTPQFKPYILCNNLPKIDNNTYGVWRRLRNIIFPSLFVDNPNPNISNQYKLDKTIEHKFDLWKPSLLNILIKYYRLYKTEGLPDIPEIIASTDLYKKDSDYFREFSDDHIEITHDDNDFIIMAPLHSAFNKWYSSNYHKNPPNSKEIKKYFTSLFNSESSQFRANSIRYYGWKRAKLINLDKISMSYNNNDSGDD